MIGPGPADQPVTRRFAERQPKLDTRHRVHQRFVNIFNRFDEVALAEDEVDWFLLFNRYEVNFQLHQGIILSPCGLRCCKHSPFAAGDKQKPAGWRVQMRAIRRAQASWRSISSVSRLSAPAG